jgi:hypothetical protein
MTTKGRWVRISRAAGMRLTDWIIDAVETQMKQQINNIVIPSDLTFTDLRLFRDPNGSVSFDWAVIERVCSVSGIPVEIFRDAPEDNVSGLIVGWYQIHRQHDGELDPVAEEVLAEEIMGQKVSHD